MFLYVGIGGVLGAINRYLITKAFNPYKITFPFGTWSVNLLGSFLIGILTPFYIHKLLTESLWYFLGIGYLGSFTTFSTFSVENVQLIKKRLYKKAFIYIATSIILGIILATIGFGIGIHLIK